MMSPSTHEISFLFLIPHNPEYFAALLLLPLGYGLNVFAAMLRALEVLSLSPLRRTN